MQTVKLKNKNRYVRDSWVRPGPAALGGRHPRFSGSSPWPLGHRMPFSSPPSLRHWSTKLSVSLQSLAVSKAHGAWRNNESETLILGPCPAQSPAFHPGHFSCILPGGHHYTLFLTKVLKNLLSCSKIVTVSVLLWPLLPHLG